MRITKKDDDTAYLTFRITQIQFHSGIENGESVDYAEITIEHFGRSGTPFSTDDECIINITIAGDKGSCGPSGLQGSCGPSGIQGPCGLRGYQGYCGFQGVEGSCGISGIQGSCGPSGLSGIKGPCGLTGLPAACGPLGVMGVHGGQYSI